MFTALAEALAAGLDLWASKEKTKYQDRLMALKKDYYEEYNQPSHIRSDAELDRLEFELRNLAIGFAAAVRVTDSKD